MEEWKDIQGYVGNYQVSTFGRIKALPKIVKNKNGFAKKDERILKGTVSNHGYLVVNLYYAPKRKKMFMIHQLVAQEFLNHFPQTNRKIVIDHKDEDKLNNRLDNLQVITNRENCNRSKKGHSSKYAGVSIHRATGKWQANMRIEGQPRYIGIFDNELDAANAYQEKLTQII